MQPELLSDALDAAYESMRDRADIGKESFLEAVKDWECFPVHVNGKLVGAVLRDGPEIHACIKPEGFGRWIFKSQLRILADTIEKHGYALTSVAPGNMDGHNFVTALGFTRIAKNPLWKYRKE